jgi:GntR family transcriptional regulator
MMQDEMTVSHTKTVDRFNQEKLYMQLTKIFLEEIAAGKWQIEQQIPTEEVLCKNYNVSKITVRQAINNLVSEGYLSKVQGKGTFVAAVLPEMGLAMKTRLTEDMFEKAVIVEKEILFRGIEEPSMETKSYLKTNDKIYYILCRRLVTKEPAYLEESYIPYEMLPDVELLDIAHGSLYSILQERGTKKIFKVVQTVEISRAGGKNAGYLDIEDGVPVLVVHRLLLSLDNTPVAYTRFLGRSDKYKFQTEFERIK